MGWLPFKKLTAAIQCGLSAPELLRSICDPHRKGGPRPGSISRIIQTEGGPVKLRLQRAQVLVKSIVTLNPEYSEGADTLVS
jgi:hypothetical protein